MSYSNVEEAAEIDESLYSRQLYVFGHEAQKKMSEAAILLIGLSGLGVEVAKNVILAGVKSVSLSDSVLASFDDLGTQFYLSEDDLGQPRAQAVHRQLSELNPYVSVSVITEALDEFVLSRFTVVVLMDQPFDIVSKVTAYCHAEHIAVIVGETMGVFGSVFCDFGDSFTVIDVNGEAAATSMVAAISSDFPCLVTTLEETKHNLETGDVVTFSDLQGVEELIGREFMVVVKDPFSFEINADTRSFSPYRTGGYVTQIKQPATISFKSFSESLLNPNEIVCDVMKGDTALALHLFWRAIHQYRSQNAGAVSPSQAAAVVELARSLATTEAEQEAVKEHGDLLLRLAQSSRGKLNPICAALGGIVGQEVLKACTGKFMPIKQWFHFEAADILPDATEATDALEFAPLGCRYDSQIAVLGRSLQQRLGEVNLFLVGAGAIGCEMLKNWAMMGIAAPHPAVAAAQSSSSSKTKPVGKVHVTDMDQIERSNLSRQFLFRNSDIGQLKSLTALRAVTTSVNKFFHSAAYETKVAAETESFFNDDFFDDLDIVCAALDNVDARLYLDQRCLFYHRPMIESGTLGTKGHTQVVVPYLTEHYGASRDPPEKSIPLCTLKSFPNQIEHTLQWARDWFEEAFKQTPTDVKTYLNSSNFSETLSGMQQNQRMESLLRIKDTLVDQLPRSFDDCVIYARKQFEDKFVNTIKQLLYNIPLDKLTSSGLPFWSGSKKPPSPLVFDPEDPLHAEFVDSVARARAALYGVPAPAASDLSAAVGIADRAAQVALPVFSPASEVIATTEEEAKSEAKSAYMDVDQQCEAVARVLPTAADARAAILSLSHGATSSAIEVDFDKDADAHMRVVAAAANLRARNYRIPEVDLHTARGIAGKIMPAIATTTALVSGLACLELYKLLQKKPLGKFRNTFSNLALPLFSSVEPQPPRVTTSTVKGKQLKFSPWDRIDINQPDMTLAGLIEYMEKEYGAELTMLSANVSILYSNFMQLKKAQERKTMRLIDVVESVTKKQIPISQRYIVLEVILNDQDTDEELEIPYLRFRVH